VIDGDAPPAPASADVAGAPHDGAASRGDDTVRSRFYVGRIVRLFPGSRSGVVRTGSGRDVAFDLAGARLVGADAGFAGLREGMEVGFDLGWTARGVRVTLIRVFGG